MSITGRHIDQHLRLTLATSIGDIERLAGIDTTVRAERLAVWDKFKHLRNTRLPGEATDPQCAAVMGECKKMAARMVNSGRLSLWCEPSAIKTN